MSSQARATDAPAGDDTPARHLSLPLVINGRRVVPGSGQRQQLPNRRCRVEMPAFTDAHADQILAVDRDLLVDVPVQEITAFLNRVGMNWRSEEYARRHLFVKQLRSVLGYSEPAAAAEADWIGAILCSHARMQDMIENELGSRFILDEWLRVDEAFVRAYPCGLVAHVLPGNVPASSVVSLLRAVLTKNVSVLKVASGDPVTPTSLALSFMEVDPAHPVSRALNVVYWPQEDPRGEAVVGAADAVCAWGEASAIAWAKRCASPEASFLAFGPRWSCALVSAAADREKAALGLAHDVSVYDQEACFSVQRVFVQGELEPFLAALEAALLRYEKLRPPRELTVDEVANLNLWRVDHTFAGGAVRSVGERSSIVVAPPGAPVDSPLDRTVIVHPVADLRQMYEHVDRSVQTVAAAPWEALLDHRDALAARGVSRFVELGMTNFFRIGGSHDGMRPLQRLVRFVSHESPADAFPKGMVIRFDETQFIEQRKFRELIF